MDQTPNLTLMGSRKPLRQLSMLESLPVETLVNVAATLTTIDYGHLRRASKIIESKLFPFFASEFFSIRQIFIYPTSVQSLVDISQHEALAPYVKKLILTTDTVRNRGGVSMTAPLDYYWHFTDSGLWMDRLSSALQHLPNLKMIQIKDFMSMRKRPRDATSWSSWGLPTLQRSQPQLLITDGHSHTRLTPVLLRLLSTSNLKLERFENICRGEAASSSSHLHDFAIPPDLRDSYRKPFSDLQVLMMVFTASDHMVATFHPSNITPLAISQCQEEPDTSIQIVPSLRHLRINFRSGYHHRPFDRFTCISMMMDHIFGQSCNLPHLNRLELGDASISVRRLQTILQKFGPSLQHLTLHRTVVSAQEPGQPREWTGTWPDLDVFLETLNEVACLKSFHLEPRHPAKYYFKQTATSTIRWHSPTVYLYPLSRSVSAKGSDTQAIIEDLKTRAVAIDDHLLEEIGAPAGMISRFNVCEDPAKLAPSQQHVYSERDDDSSSSESEVDSDAMTDDMMAFLGGSGDGLDEETNDDSEDDSDDSDLED